MFGGSVVIVEAELCRIENGGKRSNSLLGVANDDMNRLQLVATDERGPVVDDSSMSWSLDQARGWMYLTRITSCTYKAMRLGIAGGEYEHPRVGELTVIRAILLRTNLQLQLRAQAIAKN